MYNGLYSDYDVLFVSTFCIATAKSLVFFRLDKWGPFFVQLLCYTDNGLKMLNGIGMSAAWVETRASGMQSSSRLA